MRRVALVLALLLVAAGGAAAAKSKKKTKKKKAPQAKAAKVVPRAKCLKALDQLGVPWKPGEKKTGIDIPVEITGPIGGISFKTWDKKKKLLMDCSLAYSLARSARAFTDEGITELFYSGVYQRRNVRGTDRPSKHSYALAMDVHWFSGPKIGKLTVEDDYEQGLGDDVDCIGKPVTDGGRRLRTVFCRLHRSELYRHILTPDTDVDHYNHFHVEARPWTEREDAR
jgi:hypothetical protein